LGFLAESFGSLNGNLRRHGWNIIGTSEWRQTLRKKAALKRAHSKRWREFLKPRNRAKRLECVRFSAALRID